MRSTFCLLFLNLFFAFYLKAHSSDAIFKYLSKIKDKVSLQFSNEVLPPRLRIVSNFRTPAIYNKANAPEIVIDKGLYQTLLGAFGGNWQQLDAAFAFILAHELVHHYYAPGSQLFLRGFPRNNCLSEQEADRKGLLVAQLAGYAVDITLCKQLLQVIDHQYPAEIPPPPCFTTPKRLELLHKHLQLKQVLLPQIFQLGKLFQGLGDCSIASLLLEFPFSKGYKSNAIRLELAHLYLQQCLVMFPRHQRVFKLPIESVGYTVRLPSWRSQLTKAQMLFRIKQLLDRVIQINPLCVEAYIGKACLEIIQGRYNKAIEILNEIKGKKFPAIFWLTLGVSHAYQKHFKEALACFEKAGNQATCLFNKSILHKLQQPPGLFCGIGFQISSKHITDHCALYLDSLIHTVEENLPYQSNKNLDPIAEQEALEKAIGHSLDSLENITYEFAINFSPTTPEHSPYLWIAKMKDNPYLFRYFVNKTIKTTHSPSHHSTYIYLWNIKSSFTGSSALGIQIGDRTSKLLKLYGDPKFKLRNHYFYPSGNIFFIIKDGCVISWTVYQINS